jgi:hypothetical protein
MVVFLVPSAQAYTQREKHARPKLGRDSRKVDGLKTEQAWQRSRP